MTPDPFVHLHVASGYSLRHGASHPDALVARAAELGMTALALTDRDGVRGAVKFAKAGIVHGVAPILGADLAVLPDLPDGRGRATGGRRPPPAAARTVTRTPARGGAEVDLRHPRVTVLARAGRLTRSAPSTPGGTPTGAGWAALNHLVSATHLGTAEAPGERGRPVSSRALVAEHAATGELLVLLGPDSEVGRALALRRPDLARAALDHWRDVVDPARLRIEVVSHRGPGSGLGSSTLAARLLGFAHDQGVAAVLTNTVRYADPSGAATADLLDSARRLVALDLRHVDRVNAEGYLKPGRAMAALAAEVSRLAGGAGDTEAACTRRLLATTRAAAADCVLDPARDLGLGAVHLPELAVVDGSGRPGPVVLRARCEAALAGRYPAGRQRKAARERLDAELGVIGALGYETYFLTVAEVTDLTRALGVRVAARGSGAGSLVLHLLGVSGVEPMRHGLLMERFLTPLRQALPDVDVDVESARRGEVYDAVLARFGGERCVCVSMMDTYRVRHAVRDVGAALGLPPGEVDAIAKAFPHIRARDARAALDDLPELRASRLGAAGGGLDTFFGLVESLDGLPRHVALHPCGVILSDGGLLDRTPVEASYLGYPMSQFDKDDVEDLGLLKLDILGIRMQSAMAHAVTEVARVDGPTAHGAGPDGLIELDDPACVPLDDEPTFELIRSTHTLGCFQIESPGQRELIGKFGARDLRRPRHRHLAVPARSGEVRHGHAVPQGPAGLDRGALPPRRPASGARGDLRGRGVPRAGHPDRRRLHRLRAGRGRRGPAHPRLARRAGRGARVVLPAGDAPRLLPRGRRTRLGGAQGVRVLRVLQGPRSGVRPAHLPVRLAQGPPPGRVPRRGAHPRPRHVPQAADPRRRPPARHRDPRPRRQRLRRGLPRRAGGPVGRPAAGHPRGGPARGADGPGAPGRPGLRHPAGPGRGQGHLRRRGGSHRRRPALRHPRRLLAPRPGRPSGRRAARRGRGLRQPLRHRVGRPRPASRPGHPSRPAPAGRRARPVEPGRRPERPPDDARRSVPPGGHGRSRRPTPPGCARSPGGSPRPQRSYALRTCSSPSTSGTPRRWAAPGCPR